MAKQARWVGREREMRAALEKWERSGLSLSEFARREGIAQKTMYRWRRQLGVGDDRVRRGRRPGRDDDRVAPMFTEVSAALSQASSAQMMFEVVLGDGTTVRVPEDFNSGSLRNLLSTLRGC